MTLECEWNKTLIKSEVSSKPEQVQERGDFRIQPDISAGRQIFGQEKIVGLGVI